MNYRLIAITHGNDQSCLDRTIKSFSMAVTPSPSSRLLVVDRPRPADDDESDQVHPYFAKEETRYTDGVGFCRTVEETWNANAHPDADYTHVFWLEHDFVFLRPVDLEALSRVMAGQAAFGEQYLAQMALMRDAVSPAEKWAGGLYQLRPDAYRNEGMWMSHTSYFTTNPSLMTRRFMRENPWPSYPEHCEGLFTIDLLARGYRFGVWGNGEPWVNHIGVRTGTGY